MSTTIDTVRTDADAESTEPSNAEPTTEGSNAESTTADSAEPAGEKQRTDETPPAAWLVGDGPVDVSDVSPAKVAAYARRADGTVHLERKGGRTYLVGT